MSTSTTAFAYGSYGPFTLGASVSANYDITNDQWSNSWSVYAGLGFGYGPHGNSIGFGVSYGSGGFSYGLSGNHQTPGYYRKVEARRYAKAQMAKYKENVLACLTCLTLQPSGGVTDISQAGLEFIAQYEGFEPNVYKVGGRGNPTIGFGHELLPGESFPDGITIEQGLQLLKQDAQIAVSAINRHVTTPLNQHQFDALTSYVFNTGSFYDTQLLRNLNAGDFRSATLQMDIVTSNKVFLRGLQIRRQAKQNLFLNGIYK